MNKERKKAYADVAKICGNKSSICEILRKEKNNHTGFAVTPQTTKIMATVRGECSVKLEKALNLWREAMNRKGSSAIQGFSLGEVVLRT